jgi:hypothetical protein
MTPYRRWLLIAHHFLPSLQCSVLGAPTIKPSPEEHSTFSRNLWHSNVVGFVFDSCGLLQHTVYREHRRNIVHWMKNVTLIQPLKTAIHLASGGRANGHNLSAICAVMLSG